MLVECVSAGATGAMKKIVYITSVIFHLDTVLHLRLTSCALNLKENLVVTDY